MMNISRSIRLGLCCGLAKGRSKRVRRDKPAATVNKGAGNQRGGAVYGRKRRQAFGAMDDVLAVAAVTAGGMASPLTTSATAMLVDPFGRSVEVDSRAAFSYDHIAVSQIVLQEKKIALIKNDSL